MLAPLQSYLLAYKVGTVNEPFIESDGFLSLAYMRSVPFNAPQSEYAMVFVLITQCLRAVKPSANEFSSLVHSIASLSIYFKSHPN